MLACDVSGSMGADRRLADAAARRGARGAALPRRDARAGQRRRDGVRPGRRRPAEPDDRPRRRPRALTGWPPHGGTAIGSAIEFGARRSSAARGNGRSRPTAAIVLLSDGGSTTGANPLAAAREATARHIPVDTVALGTPGGTIACAGRTRRTITVPVPARPALLAAIARASGGRVVRRRAARAASTPSTRASARSSAPQGHTDTLEAGFAGAALALLALGSALSLRWFGRLI